MISLLNFPGGEGSLLSSASKLKSISISAFELNDARILSSWFPFSNAFWEKVEKGSHA